MQSNVKRPASAQNCSSYIQDRNKGKSGVPTWGWVGETLLLWFWSGCFDRGVAV